MSLTLIDKHQRHIHKLRISLLDACNMKCTYCMPEDIKFFKAHELLTSSEIFTMAQNLVTFGIDEIRVTGGEPLLRFDFIDIMNKLSLLPLKKLAVTTNATKLKHLLSDLKKTNCKSINISIDSLQKEKFKHITQMDKLEDVLTSVFMAQEMGFDVKINTVVMKGINDNELLDFCDFSITNQIPVRFLEVMRIGVMAEDRMKKHFISYLEMKTIVENKFNLESKKSTLDSTSLNYKINSTGEIGFIASESQAFCGQCSRLRLDSKGNLYPCLFVDKGPSLKDVPLELYPQILAKLINEKPTTRIESIERSMNAIGG